MSASQCRYCHHTACLVTVRTSLEQSVCLGTEAPGSRAARFPRGPASLAARRPTQGPPGAPGSHSSAEWGWKCPCLRDT